MIPNLLHGTSVGAVDSSVEGLITYLRENIRNIPNDTDWSRSNFALLAELAARNECEVRYKGYEKGGEFLWDFIAFSPEQGILVAAESEAETRTEGLQQLLKHDFEKLLYVDAPFRVLIVKCQHEELADVLARQLSEYAQANCRRFGSGSVFLFVCCLRRDKGNVVYRWQADGERHNGTERLEFRRT